MVRLNSTLRVSVMPDFIMSNNKKYYEDKRLFSNAKKTLEDIERFSKNVTRKTKMLEGESKADYLRRTRKEKREALLFRVVPERRCPICKRIKLRSKQWVINIEKGTAICRSCAWKGEQ